MPAEPIRVIFCLSSLIRVRSLAIGLRLERARKEKRLTQEGVAEELGLTRLSVIKHEEGAYEITDEKLARYADLWGKTLHWIRYS